MTKKKFHTRSFISFCLFITILWLLISGTIIFIAPPGRVAHWQHWTLFGFDKDQWQAQHTIFSYVFVIITVIHIFSMNWRNLWSYVKLKSKTGFRKKREFIAAGILLLFVFIGTSIELPPFSSFYEFGENIGFSWEEKQRKAPVPHTENLTLEEITSKYLDIEAGEIIIILQKNGINVNDKSQTLKEIAIQNNLSPLEVYSIISPEKSSESGSGGSGKGYGRMTIKDVAADMGVEVDEVIMLLKSNNIDASPKNSIKDVASEYGLHPSEIMSMIKGDH